MTQPDELPWHGQPYSTKRHGVSIANCDLEPVQTPGCVQSHGALAVLRQSDLTILQVSENALEILGRTAEFLLGKPIAIVLGDNGENRLRHFLLNQHTDKSPLFLISLVAYPKLSPLDVTVHTVDNVVVLEFEHAGNAMKESLDYVGSVRKHIARMQRAETVQAFCDIVAKAFRELTGFDRVMIYRFHPDRHGEVFAESKRDDLAPWVGLHYPAEDIPEAARAMFTKIWVRPVPDVGGALAELVPLINPDTGLPLQMTYCALRGPSMMYTDYLRNMHVAACLTMPIRSDGKLWGLVSCHHYSETKATPYQRRAACEFLAQVVSLQLGAVEDREHFQYKTEMESVHQRLSARAATARDLTALAAGSPSLLQAVDATGAAMFRHNEWHLVGNTPTQPQLDTLMKSVREWMDDAGAEQHEFMTDSLVTSKGIGAEYADVASGLFAMSISGRRRDFLFWFRPQLLQTVNWAGNPHDSAVQAKMQGSRVIPRQNFERFEESVTEHSAPWTPTEVEALGRFRSMIVELMTSNADVLAGVNAKLARSDHELNIVPLDLGDLVDDAIETVSPRANAAHFLIPRPLPEIFGDYRSVNEIFVNLFSNALKYNDNSSKTIEVGFIAPDEPFDRRNFPEAALQMLVLYVKDDGIGIDSQFFEQIFKMSTRLHRREEYGGGSAAGLAMVKRMVERHNGTVWLESAVGAGTTFYFTLPGE
jgi:chemotaxis family two-component system sensor kinase Cph1